MRFTLHRLKAQNFKQLESVELAFPDSGAVLIEGHNEAGKSTLFEAVYFALYGEALLPGQRLANLKRYGADEMRVELEFSVGERQYRVERRLRANQKARFEYTDADSRPAVATNLTDVNQKLAAELRISASALLNTCYVLQKNLERLETASAQDRRDTINELLNLRILTQLEQSFRVTQEDQQQVRAAQDRVAVARLDTELPELKRLERSALLLLRYVQARDAAQEQVRLNCLLRELAARRANIAREREQLLTALDACAALCARIADVNGVLTESVRRWQDAEAKWEQADALVRELEALADSLPARRRALDTAALLAGRLERLEACEAEGAELHRRLTDLDAELARWDALEREWRVGEEKSRALAEGANQACVSEEAAEAAWAARLRDNGRVQSLARLSDTLHQYEAAGEQSKRAAQERAEAEAAAGRLPDLLERRAQFGTLLAWRRDRDEKRRERAQAEENRSRSEQSLRAFNEQEAHCGLLWERLQAARGVQETAVRAERDASEALQTAERRDALTAWAVARGQLEQADPSDGPLQQIEEHQERAEAEAQRAEGEVAASARGVRTAALVGGSGVVAAGVMTALGALVVGIVFGVIVAAVGAALFVRANAAKREAVGARDRARDARMTLTGKHEALRSQASQFSRLREEWTAREGEARRRLSAVLSVMPASPAEARETAESLPAPPLEAVRAVFQEAQKTHIEAATNLNSIQHQYDAASSALARLGVREELARRVSALGDALDALDAVLAAPPPDTLPADLRALGDAEPAELEARCSQAERECATAETLAARREECARQERESEEAAEAALTRSESLAHELDLPGEDAGTWHEAAARERERILQENMRQADDALRTRLKSAKDAHEDCKQRLTAHLARQEATQKRLEERPRPAILSERDAVFAEQTKNKVERDNLGNVRPLLEADGLPATLSTLRSELGGRERDYLRDAGRADTVSQERLAAEEASNGSRDRRYECAERWAVCLHDEPCPETPRAALERIPTAVAEIRAELNALNEPSLRARAATLEEIERQAADEAARHGRDLEQAQEREATARRDLPILAAEPLEVFAARQPELSGAQGRTEADCDEAWSLARQAVAANRQSRRDQAQLRGIGDEPLDLTAECEALTDANRRVAVKRRAGEVVATTRQNIVSRVMPLTLSNMRRVLPLLTEGRYQDVDWVAETNQLVVYDNAARSYQSKSVFSGGAKDQISLALRLAFALATLPGEAGVRPSWLFLDEPLSSFDRSRTLALVQLLTKGLIRQQFGQIFLVSHSDSFDPNQFDHRIRMEAGAIVSPAA